MTRFEVIYWSFLMLTFVPDRAPDFKESCPTLGDLCERRGSWFGVARGFRRSKDLYGLGVPKRPQSEWDISPPDQNL